MILFEDLRLLVITPAKTGGTSLYRDLAGPGGRGVTICSPDPAGDISRHGMTVPAEWREHFYRIAILVRRPDDRLVSQFVHWANTLTAKGEAAPSLLDFLTAPPDYYAFGWTIAQTIARTEATWSEVWKIEEIDLILDREGLPRVGRHNRTCHDPTDRLLASGEARRIAEERGRADRELFGY